MMMVEPGAGVSTMSRLDLPHVVLEEGFPRPIVEPGVVEMRSGWGVGLVFVYLSGCVREEVEVEVEVEDCGGEIGGEGV